MNLTLSVPRKIAEKAKRVAAQEGKSVSAWFRDLVAREDQSALVDEIAEIDPEIAGAIGSALPLNPHPDDPRWDALAKKYLK